MSFWHIRKGLVMNGSWHLNAPDGVRIEGDTEDDLRKKYVTYCLQRGHAIHDIQNHITELICNSKGAENLCQKVQGFVQAGVPHIEVFKDPFINTLIDNANKLAEKGDVPLVDPNVAEERAKVCAKCPLNQSKSLCPSCISHSKKLFTLLRKGQQTSTDEYLNFCEGFGMCSKTIPWLANAKDIPAIKGIPGNCWNQ
jgi:hypothetical protein